MHVALLLFVGVAFAGGLARAQVPLTANSLKGYQQLDPSTREPTGENQAFCYLTRRTPFSPKYVPEFCYKYTSQSCCLAYHDYDMQQNWDSFLQTGKNCQKTAQSPPGLYQALLEFWCWSCDPEQYKYVKVDPDQLQLNVTICRSFVDRLWPVTDNTTQNSNVYDDCGFSYPTACASGSIGTQQGITFQNGGYFACGNDFVIPSVDVQTADAFMNGANSDASGTRGVTPTWGFRSPEIDPRILFDVAEDNQNCFNGFRSDASFARPLSRVLVAAFVIIALVATLVL